MPEDLQLAYVEHFEKESRMILKDLQNRRCWPLPALKSSSHLVVAFYCNAGEHRSVACADIYARVVDMVYDGRLTSKDVLHTCTASWRRKFCQGCLKCKQNGEARRVVVAKVISMLQQLNPVR